jgi:hypothetical protein
MKNALTTGKRLVNWGCKEEVSCVFVGMEWKAMIISSSVAGSFQEYGKK